MSYIRIIQKIIIKEGDILKAKIELDNYEYGIIIRALRDLRDNQEKSEKVTEPIDELLLKIIKVYEKFKLEKTGNYEIR